MTTTGSTAPATPMPAAEPPKPTRRRSPLAMSRRARVLSYALLGIWTFVVLFPLYWLVVTSLKQPIQVDSGPVYIPFVDFQPTLDNWRYISSTSRATRSGLREHRRRRDHELAHRAHLVGCRLTPSSGSGTRRGPA
jgi:hypothetical protein